MLSNLIPTGNLMPSAIQNLMLRNLFLKEFDAAQFDACGNLEFDCFANLFLTEFGPKGIQRIIKSFCLLSFSAAVFCPLSFEA